MGEPSCWCEEDPHDSRCDEASMTMTKREFVDRAEAAFRIGIDSYKILVEHVGQSHENATEGAVQHVAESASCFAGIGSCGGGGCKHS